MTEDEKLEHRVNTKALIACARRVINEDRSPVEEAATLGRMIARHCKKNDVDAIEDVALLSGAWQAMQLMSGTGQDKDLHDKIRNIAALWIVVTLDYRENVLGMEHPDPKDDPTIDSVRNSERVLAGVQSGRVPAAKPVPTAAPRPNTVSVRVKIVKESDPNHEGNWVRRDLLPEETNDLDRVFIPGYKTVAYEVA